MLQTLITRVMKLLTRRGLPVEDVGQTEPDADTGEARTLRPLQRLLGLPDDSLHAGLPRW
jgi:hypothetical protein